MFTSTVECREEQFIQVAQFMLAVCTVYGIGLGVEISGMVYAKQYLLPSCFIGANVEFELRLQRLVKIIQPVWLNIIGHLYYI